MKPTPSILLCAALAWCAPGAARAATPPAKDSAPSITHLIELAKPGDTLHIPAGVYHEHLRIDKPLTLIAQPGAIIDGDASGDIIEVTAPDVTIRGFLVRNTGIDLDKENAAIRVTAPRVTLDANTLDDILFGIDLREAPDSTITNNSIGGKDLDIARRGDGLRLWRADRARIEGNTIHDGRDAILWYSTGVSVRNNTARDSRYGLHLMYSDAVTIADNTLTRNSVGIYIMYSTGITIERNQILRNRGPSGYGIGLKEADKFTIQDNLITGNRSGAYLDGSPFTHTQPGIFTRNTFAYNDVGMTFLPSAKGSELSANNYIDNIDQIAVAGRGALTGNQFWSKDTGNFWSDYTGYDQNADGVGDFVHESSTLFDNLLEKEPSLRLFLFSPAQQAIEFVGRAVPAVRPEPKFSDEVPLMRPVAMAVTPAPAKYQRIGLAGVACVLGAVGLLVLHASGLLARESRTA